MKSLKDISWLVDEPTYRADRALSYSTISNYERGGKFDSLATLFEKKESPSLLLGSLVDTLITGTPEEFEKLYLIADLPECSDTIVNIVKGLFNTYNETYSSITDIPNNIIIDITEQVKYQLNWKPDTRAKVIKEKGSEYYKLMYLAKDKTLVSSEMYSNALKMVDALHNAPATKYLFEPNNPFEPNVERLYQLKFKATFDGINYRCMMDECLVLHDKKIIIPIDLKTSHKTEYNFYKSFIEWGYMWQAKLYTAILKDNILKDEYFKDFEIKPYIFVVVNKTTLNPLCWQFDDSLNTDDFICGKDNRLVYRSPLTIGKELNEYLKKTPSVPNGILLDKPNNLKEWLNNI